MIASFQVAREHVLPLFNDVFSAMSVAITDVDQVCVQRYYFRSLKHVFFVIMWKVEQLFRLQTSTYCPNWL